MNKFRNSAAYRIAFAYSAAIAAGMALLGVIIYVAMHIAFTRQLDAMIEDETQSLVLEYQAANPSELSNAIIQRERLGQGARMYYAVFNPAGRRVLGSLNTAMPQIGMHDIAFLDPVEGPDTGRGLAVDLPDHRRLLVAADREWIEQVDRTVYVTFAVGFLGRGRAGHCRRADPRQLFAAPPGRHRQRRKRSLTAISAAACRCAGATTSSIGWPRCSTRCCSKSNGLLENLRRFRATSPMICGRR